MDRRKTVIIAGSSGAIAKALGNSFEKDGWRVLRLSRAHDSDLCVSLTKVESVGMVRNFFSESDLPIVIINCAGVLHNDDNFPEKQLSDISKEWLLNSIDVNVMTHIHLAQGLESLLSKDDPVIWISISAMVGSIEDNRLGGWYSYRMSKAALNMFIKGLSIEWRRKNKSNKVLAVHPGTTESSMSEPFKIRRDKLYNPELTAKRIRQIIDEADQYESGSFLNWDGKALPW